MPIKIPNDLPANDILINENIFVMNEIRAKTQDIRPLEIVILNLMPTKIETETQLLRLISNTLIQIEVTLLHTMTYKSKNISQSHIKKFYNNFEDIKNKKFDGLIITGAPVETLDFKQVNYWEELKIIMDWARKNVTSTFFICWGAQAGLYHYYDIPKYTLDKKIFGIFKHNIINTRTKLLMGFDDEFYAPHSRHTEIRREDILRNSELKILAESNEAGVYALINEKHSEIYVLGHAEYDALTLDAEYRRDMEKGLDINVPANYYKDDDINNPPTVTWRGHANLLFSNWINYYVYQSTPYDINSIK